MAVIDRLGGREEVLEGKVECAEGEKEVGEAKGWGWSVYVCGCGWT